MRLIRLLTPLVALILPLAGCGLDTSSTQPTPFSDTGVVETTTFNPSFGIDLKATGWTRTSNGLYYRQVIAPSATAAQVVDGQNITVNYAGFLVNGAQFDAGQFSFVLGAGKVVPGFEQGVEGMHVGERRLLLVPAALGYGSAGAGNAIPPNATLIFVVEVVSVT